MNDNVFTKSTSTYKINGVLDECSKIVNDPKCIGNLMNKNFVNIADKLLKERKYVVDVKNDEHLSDLIKNYFEISDSEI